MDCAIITRIDETSGFNKNLEKRALHEICLDAGGRLVLRADERSGEGGQ